MESFSASTASSRILLAATFLIGIGVATAATPAAAGCPPAPRALCRDFGQSSLAIETWGRFDWRASMGPPSTLADFGDPAVTPYLLCAWDEHGLVVAADVPAGSVCQGASCWNQRGTDALHYRDDRCTNGDIHALDLSGSDESETKIHALTVVVGGINLPVIGRMTVQLARLDSPICFESVIPATAVTVNDKSAVQATASFEPAVAVPPLASVGCAAPMSVYPAGASTGDQLVHGDLTRSFIVHVPSKVHAGAPAPVVFLLHGESGSGAQIESSSRMLEVSDAEGFILVSPDGVEDEDGNRSWNAGGCCGAAADNDVDDVGFIAAILARVELSTCVDTRRVYAAGMSSGAMMSHRLACDLSSSIRAIAAVSGTDMTLSCNPARPVPVLSIHGSADTQVPMDGGYGCASADVPYRSVASTMAGWAATDGCSGPAAATTGGEAGATCSSYATCAAGTDVSVCTIAGGGHQWPGGIPPVGAGPAGCALGLGYQSQSFPASRRIWEFFAGHPGR